MTPRSCAPQSLTSKGPQREPESAQGLSQRARHCARRPGRGSGDAEEEARPRRRGARAPRWCDGRRARRVRCTSRARRFPEAESSVSCSRCGGTDFTPTGNCRTCARRRNARYNAKPDKKLARRAHHAKTRYGLDVERRRELLDGQGGVCALCRRTFKSLKDEHVDHDHVTGRVRGILCTGCNTALGKLGDNEEGLLRALAYIRGS